MSEFVSRLQKKNLIYEAVQPFNLLTKKFFVPNKCDPRNKRLK